MKKSIMFAAMLSMFATAPAFAAPRDFTGPRIEVTAGVDDVTRAPDRSDISYGVNIGLDAPVGDRLIVGVEATTDNVFDDDRIIGASARVGVILGDSVLAYGKAGYANFRTARYGTLDGLRVGGGLEYALNDTIYTKVEYRYSDFSSDVGQHQGLVGIGVRF